MKRVYLATLLCCIGSIMVDSSNASLFDNIKKKASSAVQKASGVVKNARSKASSISSKAKSAMSKASGLAEKVQGAKGFVSGLAGKVGISEDKVNSAFSVVDNAKQKMLNVSEKIDEGAKKLNLQEETEAAEEPQKGDNGVAPSQDVIKKMESLFPPLDVLGKLKSISFEGQRITDEEVQYLIEKFSSIASEGIKKISFSFRGCEISYASLAKLLDALKAYPQLVSSFCFSSTTLGDDGALSIASSLGNFPMLKYVFFSDMGISGNGAIAIISVLAKLSQGGGSNLQLVDLSNNAISDEYLETIRDTWKAVKDSENTLLMLQDNHVKDLNVQNMPDNIKLKLS